MKNYQEIKNKSLIIRLITAIITYTFFLRGSSSVSGKTSPDFKQRPFFYYELYTITFKRVFLETRFFQTAAIISQKLVN